MIGAIGSTPLFSIRKNYSFYNRRHKLFLRKKELEMLINRIKQIIIEIHKWIVRNNIWDNIAEGGIYGNVVNSVGGGVVIRGYPMSGR